MQKNPRIGDLYLLLVDKKVINIVKTRIVNLSYIKNFNIIIAASLNFS